MRFNILLAALIFTRLHSGLGWRSYKLRITDLVGYCIDDDMCKIDVTLNKTTSAIGFVFETNKALEPFILNLVMTMINSDKTEKVLLNKMIDVCAFIRNKQTDQLFKIIYSDMKKNGLIIDDCPIIGKFSIANYIIDPEKFPPYMPMMTARIDGTIIGGFPNEKGKRFEISKFTVSLFVDNSAGINRLIKING